MASFSDPLGYVPFQDTTGFFLPPAVARTPNIPDFWQRQVRTDPSLIFGPANPSAPPVGFLGDQFVGWPLTQSDSNSGGGLLGSLPFMRNGGLPASGGILQDQVKESPQKYSNEPTFLELLDTRPFISPYFSHPLTASAAPNALAAIPPNLPQPAPTAAQSNLEVGSPRPQPFSAPPSGPYSEPEFPLRVAKRIRKNFGEAFEEPLGPGPEYRASIDPLVRPSGTWMDTFGAPFRALNAALFLALPSALDAVRRVPRAGYNSAVDAFVEGAVSGGLDRSSMERLGREIKAVPEAFPAFQGLLRPMAPSRVAPIARQLTGQEHHAIAKKVHNGLQEHPNLQGVYRHRDPRFVTQAVDEEAHNGYQTWHRDLDAEIADHIRKHPELTPQDFENYLRERYAEPDLKARFPNGL